MILPLLLACTSTSRVIDAIPLPAATVQPLPSAVRIGADARGVWVDGGTLDAPANGPVDEVASYGFAGMGGTGLPGLRAVLDDAARREGKPDLALFLAPDAPAGAALAIVSTIAASGATDHLWLATTARTGIRVEIPGSCADAVVGCNLAALVGSTDGWWAWTAPSTARLADDAGGTCTILPSALADDGWLCPPAPRPGALLQGVPDLCPTVLVSPGHFARPWGAFVAELADLSEPGRGLALASVTLPDVTCEAQP